MSYGVTEKLILTVCAAEVLSFNITPFVSCYQTPHIKLSAQLNSNIQKKWQEAKHFFCRERFGTNNTNFLWIFVPSNCSELFKEKHLKCFCWSVICFFLFFLRHQPGWRTQTSQVKNHQTLRWRHVQVIHKHTFRNS